MSCLPKPVLRGHIARRGVRGLIGSLCFAGLNGSLFHFFYIAPKKAALEKAMEEYGDGEWHFQELLKLGYYSFEKIKAEISE